MTQPGRIEMRWRAAAVGATVVRMCAACAMAAAAGATGVRAWLQAHHMTWLTEVRLRRITIGLIVAAFLVASVGVSGSSRAEPHQHAVHPAVTR